MPATDPNASPFAYAPRNPVATYIDRYGEERIIHAPQGPNSALRRFKGNDTPAALINRAVAIILGENIRARRLALNLTAKQLSIRAGSANVNPKQWVYDLEKGKRQMGCRLGTLFALAHALECEPADLLPTKEEALDFARVKPSFVQALAA